MLSVHYCVLCDVLVVSVECDLCDVVSTLLCVLCDVLIVSVECDLCDVVSTIFTWPINTDNLQMQWLFR
jgi:hypothetical protein